MVESGRPLTQFFHLRVSLIRLGLGCFFRAEPSPHPVAFGTTDDVPMLLAVGLLGLSNLEIWFCCLQPFYYRLIEVTGIGLFRANFRVVLGTFCDQIGSSKVV